MRLTGQEVHDLVVEICQATNTGAESDWTNRIAVVARLAMIPTEVINWNGSPIATATELVEHAYRRSKVDVLKDSIQQYRSLKI